MNGIFSLDSTTYIPPAKTFPVTKGTRGTQKHRLPKNKVPGTFFPFGTWTALSTIMALCSCTFQQNKAEPKTAFFHVSLFQYTTSLVPF